MIPLKNHWLNFQKNTQAVSVVIGALMLTLIVVSAAVSFAIFTAQKQEEIQNQEWSELLINQEQLEVLSINDITYNTTGKLTNITFTIASQHIRDSTIQAIRINDRYSANFTIERINDQIFEKWNLTSEGYRIYSRSSDLGNTWDDTILGATFSLRIKPKETLRFIITDVHRDNNSWLNVDINDPLTIEIGTSLTNIFEHSFIPPTPNVKVIETENQIQLDASNSFADENANIVEYLWILTNSNTAESLPPMYGKTVNANRILLDHETVTDFNHSTVNWIINLTITDDSGMIGFTNHAHVQNFKSMMADLEIESLDIVDFTPAYNDSTNRIMNVNFSIKNDYEFNTNITNLKINNMVSSEIPSWWSIKNYTTSDPICINCSPEIPIEKPVTIKFKTALGNTFEKTYYPPNAIINIEYQTIYVNGSPQIVDIFDGSSSDHPGKGYIVEWNWHISTEPYLFQNTDGDMNFTAGDTVEDQDPNRNYKMNSGTLNDLGGLFSLDAEDEPFVWQPNPQIPATATMTFIYDDTDFIISFDPDKNGIKAKPFTGNDGGLFAIDSADCIFYSTNATFNTVSDTIIAGIAPDDGETSNIVLGCDSNWQFDSYDQNDGNPWNGNDDFIGNDTDGDGVITTIPDIFIDGDGSSTIGSGTMNGGEIRGDTLAQFVAGDNVFRASDNNKRYVIWIEQEGNNWFNDTNDILILNETGYNVDNTSGRNTSNTIYFTQTGTDISSLTEGWAYYDEGALGYDSTVGDDIFIEQNDGSLTYSDLADTRIAGTPIPAVSYNTIDDFDANWNFYSYDAIDSNLWDPWEEPYIFKDSDSNWQYTDGTDNAFNTDIDGDGINAYPSSIDDCGLYACEAKTLYGRKVRADFLYEDNREHIITLAVVDNHGMKSITTMEYRH